MYTYRTVLFAVFLIGYSAAIFADDSWVVDKKETPQEQVMRLNNLKKTYEKYQIKPQEKFIYTDDESINSLREMQVLYRNYAAGHNDYIYISGVTGQGYEKTVRPQSVILLPELTAEGVDRRISHWIFEKQMTSPAAKYYGDKYVEYIQRNIEFARKIINYQACDTVMSVDVYYFGGEYLNAVCGDRREIKQSLDDFRNNSPLDTSIKETYLVIPKDKLDDLRRNH